jgi:hypothetical protein
MVAELGAPVATQASVVACVSAIGRCASALARASVTHVAKSCPVLFAQPEGVAASASMPHWRGSCGMSG